MKRHFQFLSIALSLVAILSMTSCSTDEALNPDDLSISERGLLNNTSHYASLIGLTTDNRLVKFNTAKPNAQTIVAITGIPPSERILAIDLQPGTSTLYAVSSSDLLYRVNTTTGAATVISSRPFEPALEGTMLGFDYNPVDATLRIVTDADQNLRISPTTGDVIGVDVSISPDSLSISGVAFSGGTTSKAGAAMYDIDAATGTLYRQNYDSGMVSPIGSLGVRVLSEVGFDISARGTAFAVFDGQGLPGGPTSGSIDITQPGNRLWLISLSEGFARPLSNLTTHLIGITAL